MLRTTFITGFPGETDEQFNELLEFAGQQQFERVGVFTYSFEPDTPAARLPDHLPEDVKEARRERLMKLQQEIAFAWNAAQIGKRWDVLLDRPVPDEKDAWIGRAYADAPDIDGAVFVTGKKLKAGKIVPCEIVATSDYDLVGRRGWSAKIVRSAVVRSQLRNRRRDNGQLTTDNVTVRMSISTQETKPNYDPRTVFNVPNQLTSIRLVLAIVLFALIAYEQYLAGDVGLHRGGRNRLDRRLLRPALQPGDDARADSRSIRRQDHHLRHVHFSGGDSVGRAASGVGPDAGMAVVVVGRELLVTALRSFLEQQGADFSATLSGKLKMVLQCAAAVTSLYALSYGTLVRPPWLQTTLTVSVWAAVALTVISGVAYVFAAIKLLRQ